MAKGDVISETSHTRMHLCWGGECVTVEGALADKAEAYLQKFEGAWRALAVQRLVDSARKNGATWPRLEAEHG